MYHLELIDIHDHETDWYVHYNIVVSMTGGLSLGILKETESGIEIEWKQRPCERQVEPPCYPGNMYCATQAILRKLRPKGDSEPAPSPIMNMPRW